MKKIILLTIALYMSSAFSQFIVMDPYSIEMTNFTHQLKLRVLYHGTKKHKDILAEQINAAQNIYAQCGINLKVKIVKEEFYSSSTFQENITTVDNRKLGFSSSAIKSMKKFLNGKISGAFDLHVVNHLNKDIRLRNSVRNTSQTLGIAFRPETVEWVYHDERSQKTPTLTEIFGNSLFIATGTLHLMRKKNENFFILRDKSQRIVSRKHSLLAHELGHIILEGQNKENSDRYFDHFCASIQNFCTSQNLMSGGGYPDNIWHDNNTGKILGFDPLPEVDQTQCKTLIEHPMVQKIY